MLALFIVVVLSLVFVASFNPARSNSSDFELDRRLKLGDDSARQVLRRDKLLPLFISLRNIKTALLLVAATLLAVVNFGWVFGVIIAVVISLQYGALARLKYVRLASDKLYKKYEFLIMKYLEKARPYLRFLETIKFSDMNSTFNIGSKEELVKLVSETTSVLTPNEKNLIMSGLQFGPKQIKEVMTQRAKIDAINKNEFLGPLMLSELHTLGHSRLPVIDKDIDHVIGILHIKDMLSLDNKKSTSAEKAMEAKVFYIHEDQTLEHALMAFIKTKHHMFIVINEQRQTVGLITLEDVIEQLIGRDIKDEFDHHHDLGAVAGRNVTPYNKPHNLVDV